MSNFFDPRRRVVRFVEVHRFSPLMGAWTTWVARSPWYRCTARVPEIYPFGSRPSDAGLRCELPFWHCFTHYAHAAKYKGWT